GRSGQFFAFQYGDITPDVILLSKAIGGSLPLSVVVYNEELDRWKPGAHTGTFRGDQLAMAAGTVVMDRVSNPAFLENVRVKGDMIIDRLNALKKEVSIIGDVRGRGLMLGIEFINPNGPKDIMGIPLYDGEIAARVQNLFFERKLIMERGGRMGSVMRCLVALNVTDDEVNTMLDIFEDVVRTVDADVSKA
ncbi:MAG: aminotransferase class III-fold pyridoxal phosphate-dependent enzyme, partial [Sphaerochaetaceae bacterium]